MSGRARGERHALAAMGAFILLIGVGSQLLSGEPVPLYVAPALALMLLHGLDAGGVRLLGLIGELTCHLRRPHDRLSATPRITPERIARGGALIAAALAGRGPPTATRPGSTSRGARWQFT